MSGSVEKPRERRADESDAAERLTDVLNERVSKNEATPGEAPRGGFVIIQYYYTHE